MLRRSALWLIVIVAASLSLLRTLPAGAATVPASFTDSVFASGISGPTSAAFAPDGRLFVTEQGGNLRVIKNGTLLPTPFVSITISPGSERGLLGVAFDPAFATNHFVYVYYTAPTPAIHNRISRFTANGDVAVPGSEVVLLELDNLSGATNHNGGALHFGLDGKLYAAVGENANGANSQTLNNLLGKMLRINTDGTIPTDNPFFGTATGKNRAIWAMGLRNPFTFAFQPGTGRMFINDVGESTWEEINDGIAGSNYGWPTTEGVTTDPMFRSPLFAYMHGTTPTTGCAIAGGTFYNPTTANFPASYVGKYFYSDLCGGWIRVFDPATGTDAAFATGISNPVGLLVGPDGALYYLAFGAGAVGRIAFTTPPVSNPAHALEQPAGGATAASFTVTGWAIDKGATANTGVDLVHVYVYAADTQGNITGAPQFIGPAGFVARSDIAGQFGSNFLNSGFTRSVTGLTQGNYQLVVYAHSTISNNWDAMLRFIQVQGPQPPQPLGAVDTPPAGNTAASFTVSGWAIDKGAAGGTGVDVVHVYLYPTDANGTVNGAAQFLGQANYGNARTDIAGLFGPQFALSGYSLGVPNVAVGNYLLAVFAHSTVSKNFSAITRQIKVAGPQTQPLMVIDAPPANTTVGATFAVSGWAIDRGAAANTGVGLVHVYVYPADASGNVTGAPIFLGQATYGGSRPDVGGIYGTQFTPSGYSLNATSPAPGTYLLAVFAHSTLTGSWNVLTRPIKR